MTAELEQYERAKQKRLDRLYSDLELLTKQTEILNREIDQLEDETYEQACQERSHDRAKEMRAANRSIEL